MEGVSECALNLCLSLKVERIVVPDCRFDSSPESVNMLNCIRSNWLQEQN